MTELYKFIYGTALEHDFMFDFVFGINTPWLAAFVIPAKAGIQTPSLQAVSRELFHKEYWIPD